MSKRTHEECEDSMNARVSGLERSAKALKERETEIPADVLQAVADLQRREKRLTEIIDDILRHLKGRDAQPLLHAHHRRLDDLEERTGRLEKGEKKA